MRSSCELFCVEFVDFLKMFSRFSFRNCANIKTSDRARPRVRYGILVNEYEPRITGGVQLNNNIYMSQQRNVTLNGSSAAVVKNFAHIGKAATVPSDETET